MSKRPIPLNEKEPGDAQHERDALSSKRLAPLRALLLNADMNPVRYCPLSTVPWTKVMWWIIKGEQTGIRRINVIDVYPGVYVNGPTRKIELPSVVAHTQYVKPSETPPLTRFNIFLRDDFTCQYSGVKLPESQLTLDHVMPASRGGRSSWDNLVACSTQINTMKANRTPKEAGLKLLRAPYQPNARELNEKGRKHPPKFLHESWSDYLYFDSEIED